MGRAVVAVLDEPVERRTRGAGAVEARRAHNYDLIGRRENALYGGAEDPCRCIETQKVVVVLEQPDRSTDVDTSERLLDLGALVACEHFEPAWCLRGVGANVRVPPDLLRVAKERRDRFGGLSAQPVP
jgi:hypothetical protein